MAHAWLAGELSGWTGVVGSSRWMTGRPLSAADELADYGGPRATSASGRGRLVLVAGEPGIGKSRLVGASPTKSSSAETGRLGLPAGRPRCATVLALDTGPQGPPRRHDAARPHPILC